MVCALNALGANFVVTDSPTGDINNSPITTRKKLSTSHQGLTKAVPPERNAGITMTMNENPEKNNANENLTGVEGWRVPSFIQIQANKGAIVIINKGFNDWNQEDSNLIDQGLNQYVSQHTFLEYLTLALGSPKTLQQQ